MELAVNYSLPAAELRDSGRIAFDRFKCPAWPDLLATLPAGIPLYVHFPLMAGRGGGEAINTETKQPVDWSAIDALLQQTSTQSINLHLESLVSDHPDIPIDSVAPEHVERVASDLIRDIQAVIARYGSDRVIVENLYDLDRTSLRASYLPELITRVVRETGCGLLLDVSHARLAARILGIDEREYIERLPVQSTREIHVTGIVKIDERFVETVRQAGLPTRRWEDLLGKSVDHMAFSEADWTFFSWAIDRIRAGAWGTPGMMSLEYGGLGKFWEVFTDPKVLAEVVPRLRDLIAGI